MDKPTFRRNLKFLDFLQFLLGKNGNVLKNCLEKCNKNIKSMV